MKRSVFIIIGVVLIIILLAVWVYVLFIGTPASLDEQFADFGFDDTTDSGYQEPIIDLTNEPLVDVDTEQRLRQLTTRPVAGFLEMPYSTSTSPEVLYMEVGTGHIYAINLFNGSEERISATTIPAAQHAEFSDNGQFVMIEYGFGSQKEFIVGELNRSSTSLSNTELAEPITTFSGTTDNRFLYAVQTNSSVIGKVFNPSELTSQTLFTLPFREASIEWGGSVSDSHYIYPKTTRQLESFLFRVKNGVVTRMPIDGYGMSALGNDEYVLFSKQEKDFYQTYYLQISTGVKTLAPLVQIPEKCAMSEGKFPTIICANTQYKFSSLLPDSWYKGELSSTDSLWELTLDTGSAQLLVNTEIESGRQLDITELALSNDGFAVYFINQIDQTLWVFVD